ncbi:MAG TPA: Uma2 family endonuclease [Anaerolineae bacterium]|nr:Uma2 family endonuclease [Anaerolineae bacterium]
MSTAVKTKQTSVTFPFKLPEIPPLEPGERLSRNEFERRYAAMPHLKKAELIEGVVYMPSPVHLISHSQPHAQIITWLGVYCAANADIILGDNATVRLDADNEVQPDALLRWDESKGGRSRITDDDYLEGPPELIVEIAASSASYDLYEKKTVYRRNGVQEYVVWRIYDGRLDWFYLDEGIYKELTPDENGIITSRVFPGLRLDVSALLQNDMAAVLQALE